MWYSHLALLSVCVFVRSEHLTFKLFEFDVNHSKNKSIIAPIISLFAEEKQHENLQTN